ncbi:MAG: VIT and VWA domain-containing protein [Armatimonadota bacterium]
MRKITTITAFLTLLFLLTGILWADGIIIPTPIRDLPQPTPLAIKYHRVNIDVNNQVAIVKIDQVFKNPNNYQLEGRYLFPLPEDAAISKFAMDVDGKMVDATLLSKDEARKVYEDIVRQMRDPALLEYVDKNTFSARIFPIPANGEKRIKLEYTDMLKMDNGLVKLVYPLSTEKFSSRPLEEVTVSVKIKSKLPIKNVYSPSHNISVTRVNDYTVEASYEKNNTLPDKDFVLYYSVSQKDFGLNLVTYKEDPSSDGYFLLLLSPKEETNKTKIMPKEIVFVIDTSGSMNDTGKIDYAKKTLKFCLSKLNPGDYFNVVSFSDNIHLFSDKNIKATPANKQKSLKFAEKLDANGGTNIYEAMTTSLKLFSQNNKPRYLIFLTDGLPTVGNTKPADILETVRKHNKNTRLYTFGVGYDVNTILLDQLANNNKGVPAYVNPGEELETAISSFYSKISEPVLSDITLKFSKIKTSDIYPKDLPDIFKGSQLVAVGRYKGSGNSLITLTGTQSGKTKTFVYEASFNKSETSGEFIAQLWAMRRIGYLLENIRIKGENKELIDEIISLSKKYGIITPYTSFLVKEDAPASYEKEEARDLFMGQSSSISQSAPASGKQAVQTSKNIQAMKQSTNNQYAPQNEEDYTVNIKQIGNKTFYLKKGVWVDSEYKGGKTIKVKFLSKKYYQLTNDTSLAKYLSAGDKVIVCYKGKVYEIE